MAAFDADRLDVLARAAAAGVGRLVNPGYDLASSRRALDMSAGHSQVRAAAGIHPNDTASFDDDWPALNELARQPGVAAIGEIGLDYYWKKVAPALQAEAFTRQLQLARELNLPVIVHCRDAYADALELLEQHARGLPVVMHAFAGRPADAERAVKNGFWLGIGGPVTYPRADALRQAVRSTPLDHLVLETDSPFLPPQPRRGQRNEPACLAIIAESVSQLKDVSLAELAEATNAAADQLFRW